MCDAASLFKTVGIGSQAVGAIGQTYASYRQSQGVQQGYEYQAQIARSNEQLASWQAQDALERGKTTEQNVRLRTGQLLGRQEAIFGSRNVAFDEGSPARILADTKFMGERDAITVRNNTAKEAWALRNQVINYNSNSKLLQNRADSQSPVSDALGTALTTGGKVAASWYKYKETGAW